jgi:outer membrane protein TolC
MRFLLIIAICVGFRLSAQENYTLEKYINEVLQKDFGIQIKKNEVEIASNNNNPGNAGYLPTINANATEGMGINNMRQKYFSGQGNSADGAKNTSTNASIALNWTFFDGFKMFATDKKLDALEEISTLNLSAEMEMKIYQASVLFYTILQQNELNETYRQALALSRERFDLMNAKNANGAASDVQLIQARLDLTADSSVYLNGLKTLDNLSANFNQLMAKDPSNTINIEGSIENTQNISWEETYTTSKKQNTSILIAKSTIAVREKEKKEAQSYFYPQLSLFGQYNFTNTKNQAGFMLSNMTYGPTFGIGLNWTILDRLSRFTNLKNSKLQLENAQIAEQQQDFILQTELRKAYIEYEWAMRNLDLEQNNIRESKINFTIAEESYKAGGITNLELREIQFSIVQAKSRYISAQLTAKTAELNLSLLSGNFKKLLQ